MRAAAVTRAAGARRRPGRRRRRHPHARPGAGRPSCEGVPWATLVPHVDPRASPGSRRTRWARGCRARAAGRALWRAARPAARARRASRGARELNETRARGSACRRWTTCTAGSRAQLALVGDVPAARVPAAAWPSRGTHVVGPLLWEPPFGDVELPPATSRWCWWRRRPSQDPEQRLLRAALDGLADEPVRVLATTNRAAARRRRSRCPPTRGSSTGSPTRGRCRAATPSSATPATARVARALACGLHRRRLPGGGRHERERGAGRLGRRRRAAAAAPHHAARRCGWRSSARSATTALRARARELAAWAAAHDPAERAAELVETRGLVRAYELVFVSMDREWLARKLDAGRSFEAIAREVGCSPSKVSYWASKHGLTSAQRRGTRRGAAGRVLAAAARVARHYSIREIAETVERSTATVRHWLAKLGLGDQPAPRSQPPPSAPQQQVRTEPTLYCPVHGITRHVRRDTGYRCAICRVDQVTKRRRAMKRLLVAEAGGACRHLRL